MSKKMRKTATKKATKKSTKPTKRPIKAPPAPPPAQPEPILESHSVSQKKEGPTSTSPTTTTWSDDLLYVTRFGRYALKRADRFDVENPVDGDAAYKHLVGTMGVDPKEAKLILGDVRHRVVETVDCEPTEPAVFENENKQQTANCYVPPRLKPTPGTWPTIRSLLRVLTQAGSSGPGGYEWLLNWFAAKYQRPGMRSFTSVTMIGPQGVGKSLMGELFGMLLGKENTASVSGRDFKECFNSQFATKLWVVVDELVVSSARSEVVELHKVYHSEPRITLRTPHAKRVLITNRMSLWLTSNCSGAVKLEAKGDRRYSVFSIPQDAVTPEHKAMLQSMFDGDTVTPQISAELAAFAYELARREVNFDWARTPFVNETREELARASRSAIEAFLDAVEESDGAVVGELISRHVGSLSEVKRGELRPYEFKEGYTVGITYQAFLHFAHEEGFSSIRTTKDQFGVAWKGRFGERWKRTRRSTEPRDYVLAGLQKISGEVKVLKSVG